MWFSSGEAEGIGQFGWGGGGSQTPFFIKRGVLCNEVFKILKTQSEIFNPILF